MNSGGLGFHESISVGAYRLLAGRPLAWLAIHLHSYQAAYVSTSHFAGRCRAWLATCLPRWQLPRISLAAPLAWQATNLACNGGSYLALR
jgi:hypothetical protein